jgi:hypothetical protein
MGERFHQKISKKQTTRIRVPTDLIENLRIKYPKVTDADLFRVTYNTSLMKLELGADKLDKKLSRLLNVK